MTDKIKRYKKVTEWNHNSVVVLFASIIILYLSIIFLWSNWDKIIAHVPLNIYGLNGVICIFLSLFSIVFIIMSIKELKVDEYWEEWVSRRERKELEKMK